MVSDCLKLHDRLLLSTMGTKPVKRGVGSSTELPPPLPSRVFMLFADRAWLRLENRFNISGHGKVREPLKRHQLVISYFALVIGSPVAKVKSTT